MLLLKLGHEVSGYSLAPALGGAFATAGLESVFRHHVIGDIRDSSELNRALHQIRPDAVIHLAAQPLVIEGYENPRGTFETNVNGTLNLLEACRSVSSVRAVLVVTTDKVYKDTGVGSYLEEDILGGYDPYSSSKAMADLLAQTYGNLNCGFNVGVARAGNVIGLGDVSANRLIPDISRSIRESKALIIRNPESVRPWQHVLDCVYGYVLTVEHLASRSAFGNGALILNFGPEPVGYKSVTEVLASASQLLPGLEIAVKSGMLKETVFLTLDSTKARTLLGWQDKLSFDAAVQWSLDSLDEPLTRDRMTAQIEQFLSM